MTRRVAITGVGLVTPVGNDVASTWSALLAARSGAAPIRSFDASGFPVRIAAEVKDLPLAVVEDAAGDRKLVKLANRSHRFALVAAEQADQRSLAERLANIGRIDSWNAVKRVASRTAIEIHPERWFLLPERFALSSKHLAEIFARPLKAAAARRCL